MNHCKDCKHCAPVNEESGFCHRGPPQVFVNDTGHMSAWPPVSLINGWCGEFAQSIRSETAFGVDNQTDR